MKEKNIKIIRTRKVKPYECLGFGDDKKIKTTHRMWVIAHIKCGYIRSIPPSDNQIICHYCKKYFDTGQFIKLRLRLIK